MGHHKWVLSKVSCVEDCTGWVKVEGKEQQLLCFFLACGPGKKYASSKRQEEEGPKHRLSAEDLHVSPFLLGRH